MTIENNEDNDTSSILFSCRCESARPVFTLLSCLRNVSLSTNAGAGPTLSSLHEATSSILNPIPSSSGPSAGGSNRRKIQYATVFVSDTSITFQVHGLGKQSRATVDMQAGLFSEYYVAEQQVLIEDDDQAENDDENDEKSTQRMEIIKGGEFGINLFTLLECLSVLGPNSLDRTTLCLSYDSQEAIFKIELLEQNYGGGLSSSSAAALSGNGGGSGVVISNCAIPGMAVADNDDDENGDGYLTLDHAFRSHPVLARARIKSDFLKDAITELTDVSGSTAASIGISKLGLEFTAFGHSTECHVVVPYIGNHPEIFVSLEGVVGGGGGENVIHERNYPLHSILSAMRGLEIASETCITINGNGMVAIQHQVLDQVGNGDPNYVDFIMCCLEGDYDEHDEQVDNSGVSMSATQQSNMSFVVQDEGGQLSNSQGLSYEESDIIVEKRMQHLDSQTDNMNISTNSNTESQNGQQTTSLFGTVADISAASENTNNRSLSFNRRSNGEENKITRTNSHNSPRKRRALQQHSQIESTQSGAEESEFEEEEHSLDVTATVASASFRRRSTRGNEVEDPSSSPQLMYGDTHLEEASGDEDGM